MPIDPYNHAQMTNLVMQIKELERELEKIREELPTWKKRVFLAEDKGMHELAAQAEAKVEEMRARGRQVKLELETLEMEKDMLRKQNRMPKGHEVEQAEAMVEQVRQGGLVDPDAGELNALDTEQDELDAQLAALKKKFQ